VTIPLEEIARVREATDVVALVGEATALKRVGARWVGLCPFHAEKTASFSVNPHEGLYHCFGCSAGGDVITFVQQTSHLDFAEAVEYLAGRAGLSIRHDEDDDSRARRHQRDRLHEALAAAGRWYHQQLVTSPDAADARQYLRSRGYDGDVVRRFAVGWAPSVRGHLAEPLGLAEDTLIDAGLLVRQRAGRAGEVLRSRVTFPIFDASGSPVAFSGRALPGGDGPKYKNTPETTLYAKRRVLFGLSWAKEHVVRAGYVVVCEGQTDVIAFHRAGIPVAVAPCGTALTEEQVALLRRFAERIVLCFDGDGAGVGASERLYGWEQRHRLEIAVASLPEGVDPDELGRSDAGALARAVEEAVPLLAFRLARSLDSADLSTPEGRARAARASASLVGDHPDPLVRGSYLEEVARRCHLSPARLSTLAIAPPGQSSPAVDPSPLAEGTEAEMLRVAVNTPEAVPRWVSAAMFLHPTCRTAFAALLGADTLHDAISRADPDAAAALRRAAVETTTADPAEVAARLLERAANRTLRSLLEAPAGSLDACALAGAVTEVRTTIECLRAPATADEAAERLAGWLAVQQTRSRGQAEPVHS